MKTRELIGSRAQNMRPAAYRHKKSKGFSMVEIVMVMAIATILIAFGATVMKGLARGKGVSSALPIMHSVFKEAQAYAKGRGVMTRVVIHADDSSSDELDRVRYLRYVGIAAFVDTDGDGTGDEWQLTKQGITLPPGAFLDMDLSRNAAKGAALQSEADGLCDVVLPGDTDARKCFYYEFSSEGFMVDPAASASTAPRLILNGGRIIPGTGGKLTFRPDTNKKLYDGFVIWKSGETAPIRNLDNIE